MEKVDNLIQTLEPEIDAKCSEIKQKKSERLLTGVFISATILMLVIPVLLILFGASFLAIFIPIIFTGAVFLSASPILISKGVQSYEQV